MDREPRRAPPSLRPDAPSRRGRGPAAALPPSLQERFGRALGYDFSRVRIHDRPPSGAAALARGHDVSFSRGSYDPGTRKGQRLIGHELAHVAQQARGGASPDAEARAWAASERALRGENVPPTDLGGAAPMSAQWGDPAEAPAAGPAPVRTSGSGMDQFQTDSAALTKEHRASIDQLAWSISLRLGMLRAGRAAIRIVGHTDTTGTEKHNSGLGQQRADSVRTELTEALKRRGVAESQLDPLATASAGEGDLAVPTGDNVAEPRNRRVHVEVVITATVPQTVKPPVNLNLPPGWEPPGPSGTTLPKGAPPPPQTDPRSWLEEALKRDELLKQLPPWARDKAIDGLKDIDETAVDKVIDAVPWDEKQKTAAKAALKALLKTLKGQKFKAPEPPPRGADFGPQPEFPKAPGEKIFNLPPIRFNWP